MAAIESKLNKHAKKFKNIHLGHLCLDPNRFDQFNLSWNDWVVDFSRQNLSEDTLSLFENLWNYRDVQGMLSKMLKGDVINFTQQQCVEHMALRMPLDKESGFQEIASEIHLQRLKIKELVEKIHAGLSITHPKKTIKNIIHIGIGGSSVGSQMICRALKNYQHSHAPEIDFIKNIDSESLQIILSKCDPDCTLFVIASKSFKTIEVIENANFALRWLLRSKSMQDARKHFYGVSSNKELMDHWGIPKKNQFKLWPSIVGRFSTCSAIGLPIAIQVGYEYFEQFLLGAHEMDQHFINTPFKKNIPAVLGALDVWNTRYLKLNTRAILPYSESLEYFPRYIQQLEMESNGKSINSQNENILFQACPIVFGDTGTSCQHTFFQFLHQSNMNIPCEFIAFIKPGLKNSLEQHQHLLANCLAQAEVLAHGDIKNYFLEGESESEKTLSKHKAISGNQPSTILLLPQLSPYHIGALLAMYENKVFVIGCLNAINPFDQYGVDYGKKIAKRVLHVLQGGKGIHEFDGSTSSLIKAIQSKSKEVSKSRVCSEVK